MGLDMYLRTRRYVGGWSFSGDRNEYERLVELFGMQDAIIEESSSAFVEFTIGYWRKANHIHAWFVENCQDGIDECQPTEISRDKLRALRDVCLRILSSTELVDGQVHAGTVYSKDHPQGAVRMEEGKIVADPRVANDLLPTQEGFFFGSVDYDEWYWEDLKRTVEIIDKALDLPRDWSFIYQSSW